MKNSDITVVFQGSFKPYVAEGKESFLRNVRRVKQVLPGARIIISTWKGAEIPPGLVVDGIVFSDDPGALRPLKVIDDKANNLNRQLASTQAGLAAVTTSYAVKLRSDCFLEHAGFLDYYARQLKHDIGRERLVCCSFFTLDPTVFERLPYHLSDWFQFGPTARLRSYWSAPQMSEADGCFHEHHAHAADSTYFERRFRARFAAEQHICMHFAKSLGYCCPRFLNDTSEEVMNDYYRFLACEVMILDPWQIGLVFQKYAWVGGSLFQKLNNLMHVDWLKISGGIESAGLERVALLRLIHQRERQKALARAGFRYTRLLHSYMFDPSGRGHTLRKVANLVLKHLA